MGTSYEKIYNVFLNKIIDFDLPQMEDEELLQYCDSIFFSAMPKIKSFDTSDLTDRDDAERFFTEVLTDTECEVISCQMVVEWIDRKVNNVQLLHMFAGTKDENMASQANQMKAMLELKKDQRNTVTTLMRDVGYRTWVKGDE